MNIICKRKFLLISIRPLTSRIIDWDMAGLVPLEVAIKLPNFLSKIPTTDEQGIINDTDRELYIKGFRTCEVAKRKSSDTPLTDLLETSFKKQ